MNLSKFYIDGDWVDPIEPNSISVINPASEESIGNVSIGSKEDVDKAVKAAQKALKQGLKALYARQKLDRPHKRLSQQEQVSWKNNRKRKLKGNNM